MLLLTPNCQAADPDLPLDPSEQLLPGARQLAPLSDADDQPDDEPGPRQQQHQRNEQSLRLIILYLIFKAEQP